MKRKLLNAVLLTAALAGAGVLTSCKDYEEDLRNEWRQSNLTLEEKLNLLTERLNNEIPAAQAACEAACKKNLELIVEQLRSEIKAGDAATSEASAQALKEATDKIWEALKKLPTDSGVTSEQVAQAIQQALAAAGVTDAQGVPVADLSAMKEQLGVIAGQVATLAELEKRVKDLEDYKATLPATLQALEDKIAAIKPGISREEAQQIAREEATTLFETRVAALETALSTLRQDLTALASNVTANKNAIDELKGKVTSDYNELLGKINELKGDHNALKTTVTNNYNELIGKYNSLNEMCEDLAGQYTALNTKFGTLESKVNELESKLNETDKKAVQALENAAINASAIEALDALVKGLTPRIDALETGLEKTQKDLEAAQEKIDANSANISKNEAAILVNAAAIKANAEAITKLQEGLAEMQKTIDTVKADAKALAEKVGSIEDRVVALEEIIPSLATKAQLDEVIANVAKNADAIAALNGQVNKLMKIYDRLNALITSIEVQRVVNPIFGSFSLPVGFETEILANYYGKSGFDVNFPSHSTLADMDPMLSEADAKILKGLFTPEKISNGQYLVENCGLGRVYLTINPSNVNFTGGNLTLETSAGRQSGVEIRNVRYSNEELSFGPARGANNGFYVADAYLPSTSEAINKTKLEITDGLVTAVKEFAQDPIDKSNILTLGKKVATQIATGLPAYGLKAAWTANDGNGEANYSVCSKYGIAATTFKPLSYNTLADKSFGDKFPTISPLSSAVDYLNKYFDKDKFHFNLGKPEINIGSVDFNFNLKTFTLNSNAQVVAHSPGITVTGTLENGEKFSASSGAFDVVVDQKDLQPLIDDLNNQFNSQIDGWNQQMKDAFTESMNKLTSNISTQVSQVVSDLQGDINQQLDKIVDDLFNSIANPMQGAIDKANSFINKFNTVSNKLNSMLKNPNHYMQVTMLYHTANGGIHFLSNNPKDPTIAKLSGGTGMSLFATSYNADLVAPAFRKFVAITNVIDTKGNSAKGGNATLLADLKSLNSRGNLCQVLSGRAKEIGLPTQGMKAGYTYEIVYTAVDYHGYTSTQHFYLKVK